MKLSYYQQILRAVEWLEAGATITVYPGRDGGYAELRRSDNAHISLTYKMWQKVSNRLGSRLELYHHVDGVCTSFKLAA